MRHFFIPTFLCFLLTSCFYHSEFQVKNGDIIFQDSQSSQCQAIKLATDSEYTHVGVIFIKDGKPFVFEAVQPVKLTPLAQWIKRGSGGHYVVKRLKDESILTEPILKKMYEIGLEMDGKNYDMQFGWSDKQIYCSELVWKIYDRGAGVKVGKQRKMKEYKFDHPIVQAEIKKRYGENLPLEEIVVAPSDIFEAENLVTVFSN